MRRQLLLVTFASFFTACPLLAQSPIAGPASILLPEVEVRSGPSKNFFPTSKLYRGDQVQIVRESKDAPGWYEIKPPAGSFSWINSKHVKQINPKHAVVDCDPTRPVQVLPGSRLVNQEPNRESMKLTQGYIANIVDRPMQVGNETWLPIEPHPHEVRYIPAESVQAVKPVTPTIAGAADWTRTPSGFATNPQLAQAEQARQQGDVNRTRELLLELQRSAPNENQRQLATNMLAELERTKGSPFQTTSNTRPDETRTAFSPTLANLVQTGRADWSTYGRLRETKLQSDYNQPLYSLEDAQGKTIAYVTNVPGKSLREYVGRMVSVYGPTVHNPNSAVRMHYVVASHIAVP
jgi:hypothetical protein